MYPKNFPLSYEDELIINNAFIASRKLFSCSANEKEIVKITRDYQRGWEEFKNESESFLYGSESYKLINKWPNSYGSKYIKDLTNLFELLFEIGYKELEKLPFLKNKNFELDNPRIKISKYFKQSEKKIVCGEHVDYGMITLIISNENSQLELFINGKWEVIDNSKNMKYFILSGNQLEELSLGKIRAQKHRVITKSHKVRISFSLFLDLRI
tara:strand:- start:4783 stop:5418 length:636 start_codon:yes stop_codon:yes gene_type:complete